MFYLRRALMWASGVVLLFVAIKSYGQEAVPTIGCSNPKDTLALIETDLSEGGDAAGLMARGFIEAGQCRVVNVVISSLGEPMAWWERQEDENRRIAMFQVTQPQTGDVQFILMEGYRVVAGVSI